MATKKGAKKDLPCLIEKYLAGKKIKIEKTEFATGAGHYHHAEFTLDSRLRVSLNEMHCHSGTRELDVYVGDVNSGNITRVAIKKYKDGEPFICQSIDDFSHAKLRLASQFKYLETAIKIAKDVYQIKDKELNPETKSPKISRKDIEQYLSTPRTKT